MSLQIANVEVENPTRAVVTVAGTERAEVDSAAAKELAIRAGAERLGGRCGWSGHLLFGYLPPGRNKPLSEDEMMQPGAIVPDGRWLRQHVIHGGL